MGKRKVQQKQKKESTAVGFVYVMDSVESEKVLEIWEIPHTMSGQYRGAAAVWGLSGKHKKTGKDVVQIPQDCCAYKPKNGANHSQPLPCLYNALDDYMQHFFGRKMDSDDRDFFDYHPLTTKDGTPEAATLRVAQELIEPYGLVISRVYLAPGTSMGSDMKQWPLALRANPAAMMNRKTSNAEFAKQMGLDLETANKAYRFEFTTAPLRPSISCGALGHSTKTQQAGSGHASYEGPRAKENSSTLQFQIDLKENVEYNIALKFASLTPKDKEPVELVLNLYMCKGPDDKLLPIINNYHSSNQWQHHASSSTNQGSRGNIIPFRPASNGAANSSTQQWWEDDDAYEKWLKEHLEDNVDDEKETPLI